MWVALSLCWVAAVGLFSYSQIASPSLELQGYLRIFQAEQYF